MIILTNKTLITLRNEDIRFLNETIDKLVEKQHFVSLDNLVAATLDEEYSPKRS